MVVALTVVALGTSLPELVVSVHAVYEGYPGIVVGNVVGSNIANVLLVAGISAIVFPLAYPGDPIRRDSIVMIGVSILFFFLCAQDALSRPAGIALLVGFGLFLIPTLREVAQAQKDVDARPPPVAVLGVPTQRRFISLFIIVGIIGLPVGAHYVVKGTVDVALSLGVSEAIVGLSKVALGTIIGSNIFNLLAIMGVAAASSRWSIRVPASFPYFDLPVMLAVSIAIATFAFLKRPIGRRTGITFTTIYVFYIAVTFLLV
jgi:cation:H+ antiporter